MVIGICWPPSHLKMQEFEFQPEMDQFADALVALSLSKLFVGSVTLKSSNWEGVVGTPTRLMHIRVTPESVVVQSSSKVVEIEPRCVQSWNIFQGKIRAEQPQNKYIKVRPTIETPLETVEYLLKQLSVKFMSHPKTIEQEMSESEHILRFHITLKCGHQSFGTRHAAQETTLQNIVGIDHRNLNRESSDFCVDIVTKFDKQSGEPDPGSTASSTSGPTENTSPADSSVASSGRRKQFPVGAVVGGIIGGLILIALIPTLFLLRRHATAKQSPHQFIGVIYDQETLNDTYKEATVSPVTPFVLQSPPPASKQRTKCGLSLGIPPVTSPVEGAFSSPLSAGSDPALVAMAQDLRRLTARVQRLETNINIPEATDGGPVLQRPPAYDHT
ncbi:hypothetical protein DFH07DRAFT_942721 [Mycena maculata]|uniref:Mid2 domain-containing protein n=1 Tax=Mycena maculata TaxID=230809 RepID=A0AAD7ILZ9_9AGAR|nr:hypothetical protein DFH07DRAFT_942721 [Mycena maculata]